MLLKNKSPRCHLLHYVTSKLSNCLQICTSSGGVTDVLAKLLDSDNIVVSQAPLPMKWICSQRRSVGYVCLLLHE